MTTAQATTAPWLSAGFPGHMPAPTMLSRSEIDYLYWLASTQFTGRGRIVELGCFFGGSTMPLAAGLAARTDRVPNLLTYDSFIMDSDTAPRYPVGLAAGESFRPIFNSYLKDHLPRITVREGWLPTELQAGDSRRIYAEQEPIEILFVDAAKLWPVHDSILRIFATHLIPNVSILIQQDFKHHGTYWLGLHMLQLRDCFEPLHDVTGGATQSFLYKGGLEVELQALLAREDIVHPFQAWHDVDAYWSRREATSVRLFMRLAAATHLADLGQGSEAYNLLTFFHQELRHSGLKLPGPGEYSDLPALQAEFIQTCRKVEQTPGGESAAILRHAADQSVPSTQPWRDARRQAAAHRCRALNYTTIALYGAGRHTAELLATGWPGQGIRVAAIIDDYSTAPHIQNVPIIRPAQLPPSVQAVVISSEASEDALFQSAKNANLALPILRIYA